jgi:hypothetical protein
MIELSGISGQFSYQGFLDNWMSAKTFKDEIGGLHDAQHGV